MLFVIEAKDNPEGFALREASRAAHLDYLDSLGPALILAGPFKDGQGRSAGSLVIVEAATPAEAERMASDDPYVQAGLFERSSVRPWAWVVNKPEGM